MVLTRYLQMPVWRMSKHWLCEGIVDKLWQITCFNKTKLYLGTPNATSNHSLTVQSYFAVRPKAKEPTGTCRSFVWKYWFFTVQNSSIVNINYSTLKRWWSTPFGFFWKGSLHSIYVTEGQKYSIMLDCHTKPTNAFPWSWRISENNFPSLYKITVSSMKQRAQSETEK